MDSFINKIFSIKKSSIIKKVFTLLGLIFLLLAFIGIFLPVMPTTPFLLLAAACFAKGSKRLYNWLLNIKYIGNIIKNYGEKKGIRTVDRVVTMTFLWIGIGFSTIVINTSFPIKMVLLFVAIGVSIHLLMLKTLKKEV